MITKASGAVWIGPVGDIGGYGNVSRNFLKVFSQLGLPVHAINTVASFDPEIGEEEIQAVLKHQHPLDNLGPNPILFIHGEPSAFGNVSTEGFRKKVFVTIFETDRIPEHWIEPCNNADEIWVPSGFNVETFSTSGVSREKIRLVPYPIDTALFERNLPQFPFGKEVKSFKFLYTCAFDFRKGLDLLISSYCAAFSANDDVSLILKIYVPRWNQGLDVISLLRSYMPIQPDTPHIVVILDRLPVDALYSLYQSVDCYVSTDRANGWGMPCMESMAMGKPAITIDWSGSTEFMNSENAFLIHPEQELEEVDINLQSTRPREYQGHKWAVVTKNSVIETLREAYYNADKRREIANQAREDMTSKFSVKAIAQRVEQLLLLDT